VNKSSVLLKNFGFKAITAGLRVPDSIVGGKTGGMKRK
jgi:hypothetical protein